jgi:hypothetical protein
MLKGKEVGFGALPGEGMSKKKEDELSAGGPPQREGVVVRRLEESGHMPHAALKTVPAKDPSTLLYAANSTSRYCIHLSPQDTHRSSSSHSTNFSRKTGTQQAAPRSLAASPTASLMSYSN